MPDTSPPSAPPPKVAYLTNIYPSPSHTFIRREIQGLEERGYDIARYAVNCGDKLVDPADIEEAGKTTYLLNGSHLSLLLAAIPVLLAHMGRLPSVLRELFTMHRRSDRGFVRHAAYLCEAARLMKDAARRGIQHVHVHFGTNSATVARLAFLLGGPTFSLTIHGPDEFDAPVGFSIKEKVADAQFVAAITDYCASQLMRWSAYKDWEKIHRIHCTVPEEWFQTAILLPMDSNQFTCVGRLSAQKGQLMLLEATRLVLDAGIECRVVLVGDGEMRGEVERAIARLGLGNNVVLAGWQTEAQVREHLAVSRALVLPSFAEGLPMVLMESLAMQRPVVTTYITGIPELVHHGQHGWTVPPGNAEALATAMTIALQAPETQLVAMGQAGAHAVRTRHNVATETAKLDALFRKHCAQAAVQETVTT